MQDDFPYEPGYIGELKTFSPDIAADLERLLAELDPSLAGPVTKERVAYFAHNPKFLQIVAVEEVASQPRIVGTANISFVPHSYDTLGHLTNLPSAALGSFVVDETVRGKGIASKLWQKAIELALTKNVHCMQFTSRPSRGAAHGFYAKMGATQISPVIGVKVKADGTETPGETPTFDAQFELAKGRIACIYSNRGDERIDEQTARKIIATSGAARFEQLIPVDAGSGDATSVLFSVTF